MIYELVNGKSKITTANFPIHVDAILLVFLFTHGKWKGKKKKKAISPRACRHAAKVT